MQVLLHQLQKLKTTFEDQVLHLFDRGYTSKTWLEHLQQAQVHWLIRWQTHSHLCNSLGNPQPTWHLTLGKRSMSHRLIYDAPRNCHRKASLLYPPLTHPAFPELALTLLVCRPGKGLAPWYLLTNEALTSTLQAWSLVLAYARRWQIESSFRYTKAELALESPRLCFFENRLKLMMIVAFIYAFLLSLLKP